MYVLRESVMNGSVTLEILITVFDMSYEQAVEKTKSMLDEKKLHYIIKGHSTRRFAYVIPGEYPTYGFLSSTPVKVYKDEQDV